MNIIEGGSLVKTEGKYRRSKIDVSCLTENGLKIKNSLDCGGYACSYRVCKLDDCVLVIKIGSITGDELRLMKEASDLGIGPQFYTTFECPVIDPLPQEPSSLTVALMEMLDMTLSDLIPFLDNNALLLLEDLAFLVTKAKIYHGDLHALNIMAILGDGTDVIQWKLIDFGLSHKVNNKEIHTIIDEWYNLFDRILHDLEEENDDNDNDNNDILIAKIRKTQQNLKNRQQTLLPQVAPS
jgi:hypothetical protein